MDMITQKIILTLGSLVGYTITEWEHFVWFAGGMLFGILLTLTIQRVYGKRN